MYSGNIVIIGSSTGGPKTLGKMFSGLPVLNAAVIIVQHILPGFDEGFARNLNLKTEMPVELAQTGAIIEKGRAYVAQSRIHMRLMNNARIELYEGPKVNCCCPAVDVTMKSLGKQRAGKIVGVVLTGLGNDGADGTTHIKSLGGTTISQDKETSVIYGMPKAAYETGHVDHVLPDDQIGSKLVELVGKAESGSNGGDLLW
jgi:two-component system chemotaxis response regulator CheB